MANEEVKAITNLTKMLGEGFRALNANLTDCAKSLRKLSDEVEKKNRQDDDYWHPAIGPDAETPRPNYDWVLVRIADDPSVQNVFRSKKVQSPFYGIPHIAEERSDGRWWPLEWNAPYGTEENPFKVIEWRPIPGDCPAEIYSGNDLVGRTHSYE